MKKILFLLLSFVSLGAAGQILQTQPGTRPTDTTKVLGIVVMPNMPAGVGTKAVRLGADNKLYKADTTTSIATNVATGTYTPTLTNGANVAASTAKVCQWMSVTDPTSSLRVVTVSGYLEIDPTLTATATTLTMDLPICSAFTAEEQAGGVFFCSTVSGLGGGIYTANATSTVIFSFVTTDINNLKFRFTFTYKVNGC